MLDILAQYGLEWVYDEVEVRFGRLAAWLVTIGLAAVILAAFITPFLIAYNHLAS